MILLFKGMVKLFKYVVANQIFLTMSQLNLS